MRIACPSCAAEYEVPASRMTPRRMVRCERCGNEWVAVQEAETAPDASEPADVAADPVGSGYASPEEDVDIPAAVAVNMATMSRLTPSRPAGGRDVSLLAAWIASVVLLAGAATALVVWRSDVVRVWPPSARLLGLPAMVALPVHAPGGMAAQTAEKPVRHE